MSEEELQNPDEWDLESAELRGPVRRSRAVVSVSFNAEDFDLVDEAAESTGMKLSEFIRTAAIQRARQAYANPAFDIAAGVHTHDLLGGAGTVAFYGVTRDSELVISGLSA